MDPHIAAGGAHAIAIALADIHGLRDRPRENAGCHPPTPSQVPSRAESLRKCARTRRSDPPLHRRDQHAVVALSDIDRVVRSHEAGHERRRRSMKDFLGRANLDDTAGVDDRDPVGQASALPPGRA